MNNVMKYGGPRDSVVHGPERSCYATANNS